MHIAGSVQRSIHPLFVSGIHATLQARSASRAPCIAWMCLAALSECILPGLFQAISHLPSTLSRCIITIFAIITVSTVFLQVNSGAAEFFRQCEIFYHKYFFFLHCQILCLLLFHFLSSSHCYNSSTSVSLLVNFRSASAGRLHVQTHTLFHFHMVTSVLATGYRFFSITAKMIFGIGGVVRLFCFRNVCKF